MSAFVDFLRGVFSQGQASLRSRPILTPDDRPGAEEILAQAFDVVALELAGPPVTLDREMALAAAQVLASACWLLLSHEEAAEEIPPLLRLPRRRESASRLLSADLCLRYLPVIHRRARALNPSDVLTRELTRILREWPLSGVASEVEEPPLAPLTLGGHPGLMLLYAERLAGHCRPAWLPIEEPARSWVERVLAEREGHPPRTPRFAP